MKTGIESETAFRELVRESFDELPPQQQLVAAFLLEELREVPFLSVPELARRSGASEATVVRFAQRIGYSGFTGLKSDVLELLRDKVLPGSPAEDGADRPGSALEAVFRQETHNLRRTLEGLDPEQFRGAATALFKADHVYAFGLGVSSHFAELLVYLLAQVGLRATTLSTRFSSPLEQLVPLRPTDLVAAFSFPPYSKGTVDLVTHAVERGIPTLCFSDRISSPAARAVTLALPVSTENLLFTNAFGAVAVLLNALVTEVATRHQDHAVPAVSRITRILEEDGGVLEDEP